MIVLEDVDGFKFEFAEAIDAYVFDEKDPPSPHFHGGFMKGVDIVAEYEDAYVYIEMKDYDEEFALQYDVRQYNQRDQEQTPEEVEKEKEVRRSFKWLKNYLKYKYRDSFTYRYAEGKVDKPIHYICLITFENALNTVMAKQLRCELPIGKKGRRWIQGIAASCQVLNVESFNRNFAHTNAEHRTFLKCTVTHIAGVN